MKIAKRPKCHESYLAWAAGQEDEQLQSAVVQNRKAPETALKILQESIYPKIPETAAECLQINKLKERFGQILDSESYKENIIEVFSQNLLNFFSDYHKISYGIVQLIIHYSEYCSIPYLPELIPVEIEEEFRSIYSEFTLLDNYDVHIELSDFLLDKINSVIENNWDLIIKHRLAYEEGIDEDDLNRFSKFRDFMICLNLMGILIYTKDPDGSGPNMLCQCDCSEFYETKPINDFYPKWSEIEAKYKNDLTFFRRRHIAFSNLSQDLIENAVSARNTNQIMFFGSVSDSKPDVVKAIGALADKIGIEVIVESGRAPWNSRKTISTIWFPGVKWVRKFPQALYDYRNCADFPCT